MNIHANMKNYQALVTYWNLTWFDAKIVKKEAFTIFSIVYIFTSSHGRFGLFALLLLIFAFAFTTAFLPQPSPFVFLHLPLPLQQPLPFPISEFAFAFTTAFSHSLYLLPFFVFLCISSVVFSIYFCMFWFAFCFPFTKQIIECFFPFFKKAFCCQHCCFCRNLQSVG